MIDEDKLSFSSNWEIDQLVYTNQDSPASASGVTLLRVIDTPVALPDFLVQFKPTGSTKWYSAGRNSTDGSSAGFFTFFGYIQSGALYVYSTISGEARYYLWADKVDY